MNYKGIIVAGAIAIGIYLFSQVKKIPITGVQKTVRRSPPDTTPMIRQRTAQKIAQKIGKKVAQKRIGQPITHTAYIAAVRKAAAQKAAVRKAAAQKIGKIIGKKVAQNMAEKIKARRAEMARYAKRQRPQIQRPNPNKKQTTSKLFPGAERSRIIPYSESSGHSYYGPKSRRLQNEGYMVEWQKRYANSIEAYDNAREMDVLRNRKPWQI